MFSKNAPYQELIEKRRKLSALSQTNDSFTSELNENFRRLELNNNSNEKQKHISDNQILSGVSTNSSPNKQIQFPKPVKQEPRFNSTLTQSIPNNNIDQFQSLILEQLGIQKYLNLDNNQDISEVLATPQKIMEQMKVNIDRRILETKQRIYFPYGVPANFNFLLKCSQDVLKQQIENHQSKSLNRSQFVQSTNQIGKLSQEERALKVQLYREKKQKRQWNTVKYEARKEIADNRIRVGGRFVKQPKLFQMINKTDSIQETLTNSWEAYSTQKKTKDMRKSLQKLKKSNEFS